MKIREKGRYVASRISASPVFQMRMRTLGAARAALGLVFMNLIACSPTAPSTGSPPPSAVVHDSAVWSVTASSPLHNQVELELHVRNISHTDTIRGEFAYCPLLLTEAYRDGRWEQPAWQHPDTDLVCTAEGLPPLMVPPGDSAVFVHRGVTDAHEVLDDSLDPGLYRIGARRIPLDSLPSVSPGTNRYLDWNPTRVELVAPQPIQLDR